MTTLAPSARQAMSAVNTGMPASLAAWIEVPIDFESHGLTTMAATLRTRKSAIWSFWRATSNSPDCTTSWKPWSSAAARRPPSSSW